MRWDDARWRRTLRTDVFQLGLNYLYVFEKSDRPGASASGRCHWRLTGDAFRARPADVTSFVVARAVHVLAVVLWIGGVAFVTTVLIPALRRMPSEADRLELFEKLEGRFALQARVTTVLAGASGFYMLYVMQAFGRYLDPSYWWVHAMTLVWLAFTLVLFVLEPLFLHAWFAEAARRDSERAFRILHRMHWMLLTLSGIAIVGAVAGSRGYLRL
jgi:uncharacterized membrane protein